MSAGLLGQSYSQPLASGGTAPFTISYSSGTLPPGLTGSYSSIPNTDLSGIPTTPGNYTFNHAGCGRLAEPDHAQLFDVCPRADTAAGHYHQFAAHPGDGRRDYGNVISATGGAGQTYSYSLAGGALPSAITLYPDGRLVGVPASTGTFTFTVEVTDGAGNTATKVFTLVVNPLPLSITTPSFGAHAGGRLAQRDVCGAGRSAAVYLLKLGNAAAECAVQPWRNTHGDAEHTGDVRVYGDRHRQRQEHRQPGLHAARSGHGAGHFDHLSAGLGEGGRGLSGVQFQATGGMPPYTWSAVVRCRPAWSFRRPARFPARPPRPAAIHRCDGHR